MRLTFLSLESKIKCKKHWTWTAFSHLMQIMMSVFLNLHFDCLVKWHFKPSVADELVTLTPGGKLWYTNCCWFLLPEASTTTLGCWTPTEWLALLLAKESRRRVDSLNELSLLLPLDSTLQGLSDPREGTTFAPMLLAQQGHKWSFPIVNCSSSALGCLTLEHSPWNLLPQLAQQCWLASTGSCGYKQYRQHFPISSTIYREWNNLPRRKKMH